MESQSSQSGRSDSEWNMLTMTRTQRAMHRVSRRVDCALSTRWGDRMPVWLVCEYPKSGGTWLAKMVSLCMGLPLVEFSLLPITSSCVTFSHWPFHPRRKRCLYIYRDGRDVLVSLFFHRARIVTNHLGSAPAQRWLRQHPYLSSFDPANDNIELFRRFAYELLSGMSKSFQWSSYALGWQHADPAQVYSTSYEQLLQDTKGVLTSCMERCKVAVSEQQIDHAVGYYSFESMSGRKAGQGEPSSFLRKGIAGDWVNYFNRDLAARFDQHSGQALVRLGYEPDSGWVERVKSD